ncbi:death domain-containing protein 1 [Xyrichtys novacula]|uniref:Death domain-containing protein 1 n=1 Tax=Xyrichtys novacula TaxID=13765 RepID=A0AAV1HJ78_XYRNO|nr:death domain-containing protein 1 [Xyrichtys novacula]
MFSWERRAGPSLILKAPGYAFNTDRNAAECQGSPWQHVLLLAAVELQHWLLKLGKLYTANFNAKDTAKRDEGASSFKSKRSMDKKVHQNPQMEEADSPHGRKTLLQMLTETFGRLEAVRRCGDHRNETVGGIQSTGEEIERESRGGGGDGIHSGVAHDEEGDGKKEKEERECKKKIVGVMTELSVFHRERVTAWRQVLHMLQEAPPGGSEERHPSENGEEGGIILSSDTFTDTILEVKEDIQNIIDILNSIIMKLDKEVLILSTQNPLTESGDPQELEQPEDDKKLYHDALESDSGQKQSSEAGDGQSETKPSPDTVKNSDNRFCESDCSKVEETEREEAVKGHGSDNEDCVSPDGQRDSQEETKKDLDVVKDEGQEGRNNKWTTVGLTGRHEGTGSNVQDACFIKAPAGVAELLKCEVADDLSCLMVTGSEELVSRVIRVEVQDGANFHFPVTLVVPFCARYRGTYRDFTVKMIDGERRASYVTPVTTEGTYGGQRGSFAEVKVYSLGLFAVISCLKRENYTVPTKGLSLKLPMDHRICLNYLPGSFTAPVMAQTMIQPIEAVLLAAVKSRSDVYHSVVSTSPLLYLTHPSSLPLRRPLTVTLPCPPNPKKRTHRGVQVEDQDQNIWHDRASPTWDQPASQRRRILGGSLRSKETSCELLAVLGSTDKQWSILDKVTVRNQQNGVVSFELTENFERLLVVRFLSPLQPHHLVSLAEELEESICSHAVTIILQRKPDDPHAVLTAVLPSRDLNWELTKLKAQGYGGLPEISSEISMCEGDQLLLSFSGNIASKGKLRS